MQQVQPRPQIIANLHQFDEHRLKALHRRYAEAKGDLSNRFQEYFDLINLFRESAKELRHAWESKSEVLCSRVQTKPCIAYGDDQIVFQIDASHTLSLDEFSEQYDANNDSDFPSLFTDLSSTQAAWRQIHRDLKAAVQPIAALDLERISEAHQFKPDFKTEIQRVHVEAIRLLLGQFPAPQGKNTPYIWISKTAGSAVTAKPWPAHRFDFEV